MVLQRDTMLAMSSRIIFYAKRAQRFKRVLKPFISVNSNCVFCSLYGESPLHRSSATALRMDENMDDLLLDITTKFDGPVLVERLHLLTKETGKTAGRASLAALNHLSRVGHYSPYIDNFISLLLYLDTDDELVTKYSNPQWALSLLNNKNKKLKELSPETLFQEGDANKTFKVINIYLYNKQYSEAQTTLASSVLSSYTCQMAEQSAQVGLLQGNLNLTLNQDKKIESYLSTSLSNQVYLKRLRDPEVISYWRTKFLILIAEFLKGNYKQVADSIFELIRSPPIESTSGEQFSAIDILNDSNFNKFIHKDQIILISVLSILLTYPANELNEILSATEFISLVGSQLNYFKPFFSSTNSAKFQELFTLLESLNNFMAYDPFLSRVWNSVKLKFREMSFELYLSLVVKVSADHLSEKLSIPKQELIAHLKSYIFTNKLEFQYNEELDIFERKKIDKNTLFVDKLQKLTEDSDALETQLRTKLDLLLSELQQTNAPQE